LPLSRDGRGIKATVGLKIVKEVEDYRHG